MSEEARLAEAADRRRAGDLAGAVSLALGLIDGPVKAGALELAAVCLVEALRFGEFMTLLQVAGARDYLPPLLFSRVLDHCLRTDRFEII
jgi:hypothetical protein